MTGVERVAMHVRGLPDFEMVDDLAIPYNHMGATITDAVLQAGLRYETVVWPRVQHVMTIPEAATTSGFLAVLRERGGEEVVHWTHTEKLGRMDAVAELFVADGVETEADLHFWLCGDGDECAAHVASSPLSTASVSRPSITSRSSVASKTPPPSTCTLRASSSRLACA